MSDSKDDKKIDENLWRKTGGNLYISTADPKDPTKLLNKDAGSWNFQFSESQPDIIQLWVISTGESAAMATAMGGATQSFANLNKGAATELKNWLNDILTKMATPSSDDSNEKSNARPHS